MRSDGRAIDRSAGLVVATLWGGGTVAVSFALALALAPARRLHRLPSDHVRAFLVGSVSRLGDNTVAACRLASEVAGCCSPGTLFRQNHRFN